MNRLSIGIILGLLLGVLGYFALTLFLSFDDLRKHTGQVEQIWTDISRNIKGRPSDILLFKIQGLEQEVGIYHTKADYDYYLERIHPTDRITIYFDEHGGKTFEGYNLHVYQLEKIITDRQTSNTTVTIDTSTFCQMTNGRQITTSNFSEWKIY